jgi:hypothetical protein
MNLPTGTVLQLLNLLYGLKQSGREWYIEAYYSLKGVGFKPCYSNPGMFLSEDRTIIIGLYIDNIIVLGADLQ